MANATEGNAAYTVLIVEDDNAVKSLIATALKVQGYHLLEAGTGTGALLEATTKNPDVVILDLGLPDADGVNLIRQVRTWSRMPIIVVSARTEDADKVAALDAGADDYLVKPFSVEELLARLRVATRRLAADARNDEDGPVYENGDLRIDYAARTVTLGGEEVHLTPIEYKLLALLARNTGKVLTHNTILKEVWGNALASDLPSLRVFMATLRKKIEPDPAHPAYIQTHVGIGYRMLRK
ncbi:DNA-binding response regulator [Gordonibacter sp. 28C]|uniref:response regulator n=1 Tax=Gordonibacter sp. 28C TaxID=2078569 RepID=UPI000DF78011|nr:response regulator [Gordonibacter sp. 28C]RDB61944.1 DNA-binding response regulator [Gordonibacter sp. 28C]